MKSTKPITIGEAAAALHELRQKHGLGYSASEKEIFEEALRLRKTLRKTK